jgi:hypothetical protein
MPEYTINEGVRDNPLLKRPFVNIEWTEEMMSEYVKCAEDINYFCENYVKIVSLDEGLVNFEPWKFQRKIIKTIHDNRFVVIKTPRQAGKTTTSAAVILWHVLFKEEFTAAIMANKLGTAKEILSRVARAYENLPKWLQQGVKAWNKTNIELENGSKIFVSSTSAVGIRGFSINLLYLDEFAHVQRHIQNEFFTAVYPTIVSGSETKVVITSTPSGFDLFYKIWNDAEHGRNEYKQVDVHWSDVPGRDEEWKKKTIANTSEEEFEQEFEAQFIGSTNTLINPSKLRNLVFENPITRMFDGNLRIYDKPQDGRMYFITVDVSRGLSMDNSAFVVIDVTELPYRVVAVYSCNTIEVMVYPNVIYSVAKMYNNAHVLVEINDAGTQVADTLHDELEYENMVFTSFQGRRGQKIASGHMNNVVRGLKTSTATKRIGCANCKTLVERDQIVLYDFDLIREFSTFVQHAGSYAAERGTSDDMVMCVVIFAWAVQQQYFKDITNTDLRKQLAAEKEQKMEEEMLPFGFITTGMDDDGIEEDGWKKVDNDPFHPHPPWRDDIGFF